MIPIQSFQSVYQPQIKIVPPFSISHTLLIVIEAPEWRATEDILLIFVLAFMHYHELLK